MYYAVITEFIMCNILFPDEACFN